MRWSLKLVQFAGIGVFVHWTFFLLLGWTASIHVAAGEDTALILSGLAFIVALFGMSLCLIPRQQAWHDHFAMHAAWIAGTTSSGRATASLSGLCGVIARGQTRFSCFLEKEGGLTIFQVFLELLNLPPELRGMGHGFLGALFPSACAVRLPEAERFCQLPQRSDSQVIRHADKAERLESELVNGCLPPLPEPTVIPLIAKNLRPRVATRHRVLDCAGKFNSQGPAILQVHHNRPIKKTRKTGLTPRTDPSQPKVPERKEYHVGSESLERDHCRQPIEQPR